MAVFKTSGVALAGRAREEMSEEDAQVFDTKIANVGGPSRDRWGTWVSARVPITDSATGELVAVLGMDIEARAWKWDVAARTALPVSLIVGAMIVLAAGIMVTRSQQRQSMIKPIRQYLLMPLTVVLCLLTAGFGALLIKQQHDSLDRLNQKTRQGVAAVLAALTEQQGQMLGVLGEILLRDKDLHAALKDRDRDRLIAEGATVFAALEANRHITECTFIDPERVCLLRLQIPQRYGDRIDRATLLEAERRGKAAFGVELGSLGMFTLRSVIPVRDGGQIIGYLELGKEIETALHTLNAQNGVDFAITLHKAALQRARWEEGMKVLGRKGDWDRFPDEVMIYSTLPELPGNAGRFVGEQMAKDDDAVMETLAGGQTWSVLAVPLEDVSDTQVGNLIVFSDVTEAKAVQNRLKAVGFGGGVVLLAALLGFLYVLLHNIDVSIRRQQSQLQKSEERHRVMFEENPSVQILVDCETGAIIDANPAACSFYGHKRENMRKLNIADINTNLSETEYQVLDQVRSKQRTLFLFQHRLFDGQIRDVESRMCVIAVNGKECLYSIIQDITERKRVEKALNKQRLLVQALMENVPDNIYFKDLQSRFILISKTQAQMFGLVDPEQVVGKTDFDFFTKEHACPAFEAEQEIIRTGTPLLNIEEKETWPDGSHTWVCTTKMPLRDTNGNIIGTFGISHNITRRKRMEQELREREARLRAITEAAQDAILMMDVDRRILFWNPAAERIFGYTRDEVLDRDLYQLLAPQPGLEAFRDAFGKFQKTGQGSANVELQALRKTGEEISVELSLSPLFHESQWHAVGILRDITERKRSKEELLESNRQLMEATARAREMADQAQMASIAKSDFLANMSHEIRTPMNGVIGMTGLLLDTELTDEQRRCAETVLSSAESLLGLINDILDFSKIEAGKMKLEILDFDLEELVEDLASTMALRAQEKGLELLYSVAPGVSTLLRGDPGRLRQILANLMSNAIKFTHAGEVAIHVTTVSEDADSAVLCLSVRDTGIGIPKDKTGTLFEKFTQADTSTTRKYGGTGLGLAICKQLAELMGGEVRVVSQEGQGSEFSFTVRLAKQTEGTKAESFVSDVLHAVRVLVVDDNATNREILTTYLTAWGMRAAETSEGPSALKMLALAMNAGDPFQIAIFDMQMPIMDGEMLGRAIKADARLASTRMVMLASHETRDDPRHLIDIGFSACLMKPVRHQELKRMLSLVLSDGRDKPFQPQQIVAKRRTPDELFPLSVGNKARILLAEDNMTNQQVALGILKKLGLRADAVANGEEVLKALETLPYDLVLMDVQMPVMDGMDATRKIRSPQSTVLNRSVPVIAMTARAMQGDREKCLEAGMNDYVPKPVTPLSLANSLAKWMTMEVAGQKSEAGSSGGTASQSEPQTPSLPVWDLAGFIERVMDDKNLAMTVLKGFSNDISQRIQALKASLEAEDAAAVNRQAHSINGAASIIGGNELRATALEIEKSTRAGNLAAAASALPELIQRFERLRKMIETQLKAWSSGSCV